MGRGLYISSAADLSDVPAPEANFTYALPSTGANQNKLMVYNGTMWVSTPVTGTITVQEVDGSPLVNSVTTIKVSNTTLTDNGSGTVTIATGSGGGGGGARSGVDPATASYIKDDFNIGTATAAIGELRWFIGNGSCTIQLSEASHPGIIRLSASSTGSLTLKDTSLSAGRDQVLFADTFDMYGIMRANGTLANQGVRFGLFLTTTTATANPPTDGIYFERLTSDTNWFGVVRASSAQTRVDTAVVATTSFQKLRIRRIDASTIGFTVGSATEVTNTATAPASTGFSNFQTQPSGTQTIDIDFYDMLITLSR